VAIKNRVPKSEQDKKEIEFLENIERDNYSTFNEFQLVDEYLSIDQQSQLLKGRVLCALREKFPSNIEFGEFVEQHVGTICSDTRQSRTRFMNLARYFSGSRTMEKISLSVAYEISSPAIVKAGIADEIYETVRGKDMSVADVRALIANKKGENLLLPVGDKIATTETVTESLPIETSLPQTVTESIGKSKVEVIMTEILADMTKEEKSAILRECLRDINLYPSKSKLK
jgi:hypothetical protein